MKCCIPGSICRIASTSVENYFSFTEARRNLSSLSLMLLMCFNSLHAGVFFPIFASLLIVFDINFFQKIFEGDYQSVKRFGSRSGPILYLALFVAKMFARVISR